MNELLTPSKIIHSKRRSIALVIDNNGDLIVRAPLKCTDESIISFILKKQKWIIEKRTQIQNSNYKIISYKDGDIVPILGKDYIIKLIDIKKIGFEENTILLPTLNPERSLKRYLINLAVQKISERVKYYSANFNFHYRQITITSAKTRWGSCGYNNGINFTYKLIMCPIEVVDYIVVHELCHTVEKNHSKKFWARVEAVLPNYKAQEKWLKDNKLIIDII